MESLELDFKPFDADNHYYEATDAFTRHIDPKMAKRAPLARSASAERMVSGSSASDNTPVAPAESAREAIEGPARA